MVTSLFTILARRVFPGQVFTSSTSTPVAAGWATYFSSIGRNLVTNGSALSTTIIRLEPAKGSVCSSSFTSAKVALSPE